MTLSESRAAALMAVLDLEERETWPDRPDSWPWLKRVDRALGGFDGILVVYRVDLGEVQPTRRALWNGIRSSGDSAVQM